MPAPKNPMLIFVCICSLWITNVSAEPNLKETQNYIIEKTDTSWKKKRSGLLIQQLVSFKDDCQMEILHRFTSLKKPDVVFADEVARVPTKHIYKILEYGNQGLALRVKGDGVTRQNTYYPAHREHKNHCGDSEKACPGPIWTREKTSLRVISPADHYNEKLTKALRHLKKLCPGEEELF